VHYSHLVVQALPIANTKLVMKLEVQIKNIALDPIRAIHTCRPKVRQIVQVTWMSLSSILVPALCDKI
jgi:hypothetical protein